MSKLQQMGGDALLRGSFKSVAEKGNLKYIGKIILCVLILNVKTKEIHFKSDLFINLVTLFILLRIRLNGF